MDTGIQKPHDFLPPGEVLGGCTLLQLVGKGSMGAVYRAWQTKLSRQVAVKVLMKARFDQLVTAERFLQEAETVANLRHPNILSVFDSGEREDCVFFVMEYLEGPSLAEWAKRKSRHPVPSRRRVSLQEVKDVASQALSALDYAHEQGVIHRDIKPENLLWAGTQKLLKVTDFGLASVHYVTFEVERHFILGSPLYVSPEQARGDELDGRADLFSLGCVLLELLVGKLPVHPDRPERIFRMRAKEDPAMFTHLPQELRADLPESWCEFLHGLLAPKMARRFPNAHETLAALDALPI
jgi:serine/threonine-protein kinase